MPKKCLKERLPVVTSRLGTFVGTFKFRGERGYTTVSADRIAGGLGDPLANGHKKLECEKPVTKSQIKRELKEVVLESTDRSAGVTFQASRLPVQFSGLASSIRPSIAEKGRYLFAVFAAEKAEQMFILRFTAAVGPAADFTFDNALTAATVQPPAPFTGTGSFQRNADGSIAWTGTLDVPVAGLGTVRLTDPSFKCELATLATLAQRQEEELKSHLAAGHQ